MKWGRFAPISPIFAGVIVVVLAAAACSSSSDSSDSSAIQENPCATRGATYLLHVVERPSGTCGAVPDQTINVNKDGTMADPPQSCQAITRDGCTERNTNCVLNVNGVTCQTTLTLTFKEDGSSATGSQSISCSGARSCSSTYDLTLTRR